MMRVPLRVNNKLLFYSHVKKKNSRKILENLDSRFRYLGKTVKLLQEDATNSIREMCVNNCTEFHATAGTVLTEIGKLMKELCKNTVDLA